MFRFGLLTPLIALKVTTGKYVKLRALTIIFSVRAFESTPGAMCPSRRVLLPDLAP
jgi:hypothetical protein